MRRLSMLLAAALAAMVTSACDTHDPAAREARLREAAAAKRAASARALEVAAPPIAAACARLRASGRTPVRLELDDGGADAALAALARTSGESASPLLDREARRFTLAAEALITRSLLPNIAFAGGLGDEKALARSTRALLVASCDATLDAAAALRREIGQDGSIALRR